MRVVVPYTARHLDTIAGVPPEAEWHYVGDDNEAYWRLVCRLWVPTGDLAIVEHDVVCRPDIIQAFIDCPELWCGYPYDDQASTGDILGCVRFREELIQAVPDAATAIPPGRFRDWHELANGLAHNLRPHSTHWHEPPVRHHHMRLGDG